MYWLYGFREVLEGGLNFTDYEKYFSTLLYMEEHQMMYDIRRYDLTDVEMIKKRNLLELDVSCYIRISF